MAARWCRRVVAIVAGPGFGKSVLLAQAAAENNLAPRGVDVMVRCTDADAAPGHLVRRIAEAIGVSAATDRSTVSFERLFAELNRRWPLGVCLMIDDADLATSTDDGARLVARLVTDAPLSVHFVLASRRRPRGLAALRAAGQVVELDEASLSLDPCEVKEFALAHRVDEASLSQFGGWPAAVSLAATCGLTGATEYLWESVLDHLNTEERRVLEIAAAIGGGDAALMRAAVGDVAVDPIAVLAELPLVHLTSGGELVVHDLWHRVVAGALPAAELRAAVARAVDGLIERCDFDRAFRLCCQHNDWDQAAGVLTACCRRGHAAVPPDVLAGWLAAWPKQRRDDPAGLLLRGLVGRVSDPFGQATAELLEQAVAGYRAISDVAGEVAAGVELVYVLRNQGRCAALPAFLARAAELDAAGHPEIAGPAALGRALMAELAGDDRVVAAELDDVPAGTLSTDWQVVVAFRRTIAHLIVGNEHAMLDAARRCAQIAGDGTSRHVLPLAQWFAGDARAALASCDAIVAEMDRSQIDAVTLGSFATTVLASAGRLEEASCQLARLECAASGSLSALIQGSLVGARAVVAVAGGDDDGARKILEDALSAVPLSSSIGWRASARWLPLAYVLIPDCRGELDDRPMGSLHRRRLAVARAVVWAVESDGKVPPGLDDVMPCIVSTSVPLPWSAALAARLAEAGNSIGHRIAAELLGVYGEHATKALRALSAGTDRRLASGARKLLADVKLHPRHDVRLEILGPTVLYLDSLPQSNASWNRERVRSLMLYLVLHGPSRREQIMDALWPDLDAEAGARNLRVTLFYLNQVLEPDRCRGEASFFIRPYEPALGIARSSHFMLDSDELESLIGQADDADERGLASMALDLYEQAVALWHGQCLSDVLYEDWAQTARTRLTDRFVGAALRAAELNLAAGNLCSARSHALRALTADEWCERAHRILIAVALARGDRAGAARALTECEKMLESLGVRPDPQTEMLRRHIFAAERTS
jgi:DNA-binding SARP family transcriptional activator